MRNRKVEILPEFTSALTKREAIAVGVYLPVHIVILPTVISAIASAGYINYSLGNFLLYAIVAVYMTVFAWHFLRRDFDPLCDRFLKVLIEVGSGYIMMLFFNYALALILSYMGDISSATNPNNQTVVELAYENMGLISAMAIYLAPIAEEVMFRGLLFGYVRKRNRIAAYIFSMLAFSLYHVWGYAVTDPYYWIYLLQYLPISWLLCRCYERTNTIWSSIMLHALVNAISINAMTALQELAA